MRKFIFISIVLLVNSLLFSSAKKYVSIEDLINQKKILTPNSKNYPLALFNGDTIREYNIFGGRGVNNIPKEIPILKKEDLIRDYVLNKAYEIEGRIPSILNSSNYIESRQKIVDRYATEYLMDQKIVKSIFNDDSLRQFYKNHRGKYSETYQKCYSDLFKDFKKSRSKMIKKVADEYLDSIRVKYEVFYNDSLFKEIASLISRSKKSSLERIYKKFGKVDAKVLISGFGNKVMIIHLINHLENVHEARLRYYRNPLFLRAIMEGKVLNPILVDIASKYGYTKLDSLINLADTMMDSYIGRKFKEIKFKLSDFYPTGEEAYNYYLENRDTTKYMRASKRADTHEIFFSFGKNGDKVDKIAIAKKAEEVRQKVVENPRLFDNYKKFYHRDFSNDGELGFIKVDSKEIIAKPVNSLKVGEISDLIFLKGGISIVKPVAIDEEKPFSFNLLEKLIREDMAEQRLEIYRKNLEKDLIKKYKIKFFPLK
ncbi:MAG: hypothetical protein CR982_09420 [Candidatus Cloacimonadota bacterium]|nr:MAG: hypothetical protein CR982_09420 [Candidatus Cloacimonadota bacterium]PIE77528.1 MAG: hypothetical protein CSA15_12710 [Candidatus Delongbacteria bacterium]